MPDRLGVFFADPPEQFDIVSEIDHEELRSGSMEQFEAFIRVLGDAILRTAS